MTLRWLSRGISLLVIFSAGVALSQSAPRVTRLLQNDFSASVVVDSVLIAAGNNSLYSAVFNATTEQFEPFALSDYTGPAMQIKHQGSSVVVRSESGALTFLDASALPALSILGTVFPPTDYREFCVDGTFLYLVCGFEGIRSYELSGYASLTLIDSTLEPVHAIDIAAAEGSLFVVDDYNGLWLYQPVAGDFGLATSVVTFDSSATAVAVRNDSVFVGTAGNGLVVIRKNLTQIEVIDTLEALFATDRVMVVDTFVLGVSSQNRAGDLSSLNGYYNPLFFGADDHVGSGSTFRFGNYAYLVWPAGDGRLNLVNLTLGFITQFAVQEANPAGGTVTGLCMLGSDVVVTRQSLATLRCDQDSSTGRLFTVPLLPGLGSMTDVRESEGRLYFLSSTRNSIAIAARVGAEYELLSLVDLPADDFTGIRVTRRIHDSLRLLTALAPSSIELIKISNDEHLTMWGRLILPERPLDIATVDSMLIVAGAQNAYVYSLDADLFPSYQSTIYFPPASGAIINVLSGEPNSSVITLAGEHALRRYDLSDPKTPAEMSSLPLPSAAVAAIQSGDQVFVTTRDDGVLRISMPLSANPAIVDSVRVIGTRLAVLGSQTAVASDHGVWLVDWDIASDVASAEQNELPGSFNLAQNYPNPFNPETAIEFSLDRPTRVNLEIFNSLGQQIGVLVDGVQLAGAHRVTFSARNLASGVYLYRLSTPYGVDSRKMVLVR